MSFMRSARSVFFGTNRYAILFDGQTKFFLSPPRLQNVLLEERDLGE
jgi:hypothetical protein